MVPLVNHHRGNNKRHLSERKNSRALQICLGIESTAHTFGVSVVSHKEGKKLGSILSDVKNVYKAPPGSGIHPREASHHHAQVATEVLQQALQVARINIKEVNAIAYSEGPGLGPCLRVGAVVARALSSRYQKPLIPVHHGVAHIELGAMLTGLSDPVVLLVSGGHTMINAHSGGRWRIFGETLDLTIGQLVDQFGREAGHSSPCGQRIERLAQDSHEYISLPYSVKGNDVSFSGLLTAAKNLLHDGRSLSDLCYSMQETAFDMLAEVTERALAFTEKQEVLLVGGVAANNRLKEILSQMCLARKAKFASVPIGYSGDCGAQIAWTGLVGALSGASVPIERSKVHPSWRLDRVNIPWRN